jgi:hypothetical protein
MATTTTSKASKASKGNGTTTTRKARQPRSLTRGEVTRAATFFALAGAGLCVSLPHLASEVALLTGAGGAAAWFTAIVIDLGLCASKAHLSANGPKRGVAWGVVVSCTLLSVALNCHAFLAHASDGFGQVAAVAFGGFIPLFVVAMSYLASEILLQRKK